MFAAQAPIVVIVFGILVAVLSAGGIVAPQRLIDLVGQVMDHGWGIGAGVAARVLLGVALIFASPFSRFPYAFEALGWIALIAAVGLLVMGRARMRRFIDWFRLRLSQTLIRVWLLIGLAFGAFLVYGAA